MKKKITLFAMALLTVVGTKADVIPSSYYSEPAAGTYYIYNVTEGKFLRTDGVSENNYSLLDAPVAVTLTAKGETVCKGGGDYILSGNTDNFIKIGYWGGQWLWSNAASGNADILAWTFNSNGTKTYTMSIALSEAFSQNGSTLAVGTYYMKDVTNLGSDAEAGTYALITEANYYKYLATTTATIPATYYTTTPAAGTYYLYSPYANCFICDGNNYVALGNTPEALTITANGDNFDIQLKDGNYMKYGDGGKLGNAWADGTASDPWAFETFHDATGLFFLKNVGQSSYLYAFSTEAATKGAQLWGTAETNNTRYAWALISETNYTAWQNSFNLSDANAVGFSTVKDIYNVNVTVNRAMTANVWNTLVVPFDMDIPSGWSVVEPTAFSEGTLTFGAASSIEAGKPYLVKPTEAVTSFSATNVTLKKDLVPTEVGSGTTVTMMGTYSKIDAVTEGDYIIGIKNGESKLYKVNGTVMLKPFRAYFTVSGEESEAKANVLELNFDDTATGIDSMFNDQRSMSNSLIYNLAGQMVNAKRSNGKLPKGLYIVNGKKVFIK